MPGGDHDYNDKNWGKDKCYTKHVTKYETKTAYETKTSSWVKPVVTKVPVTSYVEKTYYETKYKTDTVTKPYTKSYVSDEKVCKTKWYGDHWDYSS